ncbi:MAG: hypothetical protein LBQ79_04985 [Deltaproteobacteria bacterium]|jgi:hypothetical protein|nr:hypothetical protein [Deltaproteobacteria bacterium]
MQFAPAMLIMPLAPAMLIMPLAPAMLIMPLAPAGNGRISAIDLNVRRAQGTGVKTMELPYSLYANIAIRGRFM